MLFLYSSLEDYVGKIRTSKLQTAMNFRVFDPRTVARDFVLRISHLPSKLRFSAKYSFFGQSVSRGHHQPTYQPPEGVY